MKYNRRESLKTREISRNWKWEIKEDVADLKIGTIPSVKESQNAFIVQFVGNTELKVAEHIWPCGLF
jgi:hypothetical protein